MITHGGPLCTVRLVSPAGVVPFCSLHQYEVRRICCPPVHLKVRFPIQVRKNSAVAMELHHVLAFIVPLQRCSCILIVARVQVD